jgi:hypothetical protein
MNILQGDRHRLRIGDASRLASVIAFIDGLQLCTLCLVKHQVNKRHLGTNHDLSSDGSENIFAEYIIDFWEKC